MYYRSSLFITFLIIISSISFSQEYEVEITESNNLYFATQIDSMMKLDQKIRKLGNVRLDRIYKRYQNDLSKNKTDRKYLKALEFYKQWTLIDSLNYSRMLQLIKEFGFPSEKKVGYSSYMNSYVMFLHYVMMPNYNELQVVLDTALKNKEIEPQFYADVTDRHRFNNNLTPLYYLRGYCDYPTLSVEEKKIISDNRKRIGLKPMVAKCGMFKKKFLIE